MSSTCRRYNKGFTLMEVMVALFIMALIALLASQAFTTASSGAAATREAMERLAAIDRTMVLVENDLRNAVPKVLKQRFGEPLPPLFVAQSDDYWLTVMRGGMANPLFQRRTEEVRVGYRYIEETIWRDTWYNPAEVEQDQARQQKLLEGVTDMVVRVLPPNASSLAAGPWLDAWPANPAEPQLPLAIELTLTLEDMGEIKRLFMLLPGKGGETGAGTNPPGGQPNSNPPNNNENPGENTNPASETGTPDDSAL